MDRGRSTTKSEGGIGGEAGAEKREISGGGYMQKASIPKRKTRVSINTGAVTCLAAGAQTLPEAGAEAGAGTGPGAAAKPERVHTTNQTR